MCIDFNKPRYVIVLKNPKSHRKEFVSKGECGYPIVVGYFSLENTYYTIKDAQDYINTMIQFNMWIPGDGLTLDNLQIQKVVFKFKDVEVKNAY